MLNKRSAKRVQLYIKICDKYGLTCDSITWSILDTLSSEELRNKELVLNKVRGLDVKKVYTEKGIH